GVRPLPTSRTVGQRLPDVPVPDRLYGKRWARAGLDSGGAWLEWAAMEDRRNIERGLLNGGLVTQRIFDVAGRHRANDSAGPDSRHDSNTRWSSTKPSTGNRAARTSSWPIDYGDAHTNSWPAGDSPLFFTGLSRESRAGVGD